MNEYTAIVKRSGNWWIGWIEEVPGVTCQEATREELLITLEITLKEMLELNREDALATAGKTIRKNEFLYETQGVNSASSRLRLQSSA